MKTYDNSAKKIAVELMSIFPSFTEETISYLYKVDVFSVHRWRKEINNSQININECDAPLRVLSLYTDVLKTQPELQYSVAA